MIERLVTRRDVDVEDAELRVLEGHAMARLLRDRNLGNDGCDGRNEEEA
jgi:hypothetical protein